MSVNAFDNLTLTEEAEEEAENSVILSDEPGTLPDPEGYKDTLMQEKK